MRKYTPITTLEKKVTGNVQIDGVCSGVVHAEYAPSRCYQIYAGCITFNNTVVPFCSGEVYVGPTEKNESTMLALCIIKYSEANKTPIRLEGSLEHKACTYTLTVHCATLIPSIPSTDYEHIEIE